MNPFWPSPRNAADRARPWRWPATVALIFVILLPVSMKLAYPNPVTPRNQPENRAQHPAGGAATPAQDTASEQGAVEPKGKPRPFHHTDEGFRNNHPHESHGLGAVIKWRWDHLMGRSPDRPEVEPPPPMGKPDLEFLRNNASLPSVTWIGHATLLLQIGGRNILTDPQFSERASPFSWVGPTRKAPPGIPLKDLPPIDAVTISHNHYDHLDKETVLALVARQGGKENPRFFVPLGLKAWFADLGVTNVVELDWWQEAKYRGVLFTAVPAQHFSARGPFDRNETLWAGWVVAHPTFRFYHSGDTGYSPDFKEIGRRMAPLDLAALPIGAYEPRWFMRAVHLNPAEAVRVHGDLGARYSVAMHWGTFDLTDEPLSEPPLALARERDAAGIPPERFFVMRLGETRPLHQLEP